MGHMKFLLFAVLVILLVTVLFLLTAALVILLLGPVKLHVRRVELRYPSLPSALDGGL